MLERQLITAVGAAEPALGYRRIQSELSKRFVKPLAQLVSMIS